MPVTSLDISAENMKYINRMVTSGKTRSLRAFVDELINLHRNLSMEFWERNLFYFHGLRHAIVSQKNIEILMEDKTDEEIYHLGKRLGKSWVDNFFAKYGIKITREKWHQAFEMLEFGGFGHFIINENKIILTRSFYPLKIMHGYLETGLGVELVREDTEQIGVFSFKE